MSRNDPWHIFITKKPFGWHWKAKRGTGYYATIKEGWWFSEKGAYSFAESAINRIRSREMRQQTRRDQSYRKTIDFK